MAISEDEAFEVALERPGWTRPERGVGERWVGDKVAYFWLSGDDTSIACGFGYEPEGGKPDRHLKKGEALVTDKESFKLWLAYADSWLDGTLPKRKRTQKDQGVFNG
jgi:hypothetical protein